MCSDLPRVPNQGSLSIQSPVISGISAFILTSRLGSAFSSDALLTDCKIMLYDAISKSLPKDKGS
jgi:hypothetical protein